MSTYCFTPPERLQTTIKLPASKSISNRVLIIHALTGGDTLPQNLSDCDDTEVIIRAMQTMPDVIDIKAAGTAMRFMTAYLAVMPSAAPHLLTGTERMKHRPIKVLVDALRSLGANINYAGEKGFPPLNIRGKRLEGGELTVAGNISSQFISALLLIGPALKQGLTLRLTGDIISRPYIDLTLWTMREFGADAEWTSIDTIEVKPKPYTPRPYLIENDWSAASYWYEMVALSPDDEAQVVLEGLMDGSKQGDSSVRYIFSLLGVKTKFRSRKPGVPTTVTLSKSGHRVTHLDYDFTNAPDLAQTIVCTCCALGVPFHFTGLQTLRIKETDRIMALKTELRKLGFVLHDKDGRELTWTGEMEETVAAPSTIDTYDDHRMALAFAPMSLLMPIAIRHPEVVTKSYPHFWHDLQQAGFTIDNDELRPH
ncbi:MAG: 3-phosphoshikimate 1-carboxyvinyltransferase [Prevotella sp.]|nr:3-phosphoshikimate 1-carboxyvinyltransferase [Prevotella sp.]